MEISTGWNVKFQLVKLSNKTSQELLAQLKHLVLLIWKVEMMKIGIQDILLSILMKVAIWQITIKDVWKIQDDVPIDNDMVVIHFLFSLLMVPISIN